MIASTVSTATPFDETDQAETASFYATARDDQMPIDVDSAPTQPLVFPTMWDGGDTQTHSRQLTPIAATNNGLAPLSPNFAAPSTVTIRLANATPQQTAPDQQQTTPRDVGVSRSESDVGRPEDTGSAGTHRFTLIKEAPAAGGRFSESEWMTLYGLTTVHD